MPSSPKIKPFLSNQSTWMEFLISPVTKSWGYIVLYYILNINIHQLFCLAQKQVLTRMKIGGFWCVFFFFLIYLMISKMIRVSMVTQMKFHSQWLTHRLRTVRITLETRRVLTLTKKDHFLPFNSSRWTRSQTKWYQ